MNEKGKVFDFKDGIVENELVEAADAIRSGKLVIFPTETVYGIGANALSEEAVSNIFLAKGRASDNPLIAHISNFEMLKDLVMEVSPLEQKIIDAFWPGPLTIILPKKKIVPYKVTAGLDTVAIRMPENEIALKLIEKSKVPIAAPSANVSGRPSGTNIEDIIEELSDKVSIIIDGGPTNIGVESTVIRVVDDIPVILRPGKITPEDLIRVAGKVKIDNNVYSKPEENSKVLSPGMKYKHYAPNSNCILVTIDDGEEKQIEKVNNIINENTNKKVLVLSCTEHMKNYNTDLVLNMGSKDNYNEISKNIFTLLRKVDSYLPDLVVIEGVKKEGIGIAIMNRLIRACGYNII